MKENTRKMFGLDACMKSVKFEIEDLNKNPFELLGRYYIRAKQDIFFNKTMIKALELYIEEKRISWDKAL